MGPVAQQTVPQLIDMLQDKNEGFSETQHEALGTMGHVAKMRYRL